MRRNELAKWHRNKNVDDFRDRILNIKNELAVLKGKSVIGHDLESGLSGKIKYMKREIATLKTIAHERKFKL